MRNKNKDLESSSVVNEYIYFYVRERMQDYFNNFRRLIHPLPYFTKEIILSLMLDYNLKYDGK